MQYSPKHWKRKFRFIFGLCLQLGVMSVLRSSPCAVDDTATFMVTVAVAGDWHFHEWNLNACSNPLRWTRGWKGCKICFSIFRYDPTGYCIQSKVVILVLNLCTNQPVVNFCKRLLSRNHNHFQNSTKNWNYLLSDCITSPRSVISAKQFPFSGTDFKRPACLFF